MITRSNSSEQQSKIDTKVNVRGSVDVVGILHGCTSDSA
jgi:hypothetical protein